MFYFSSLYLLVKAKEIDAPLNSVKFSLFHAIQNIIFLALTLTGFVPTYRPYQERHVIARTQIVLINLLYGFMASRHILVLFHAPVKYS